MSIRRHHFGKFIEHPEHFAAPTLQVGQDTDFFAELLQLIFFPAQRFDGWLDFLILALQLAQAHFVLDRITQPPADQGDR